MPLRQPSSETFSLMRADQGVPFRSSLHTAYPGNPECLKAVAVSESFPTACEIFRSYASRNHNGALGVPIECVARCSVTASQLLSSYIIGSSPHSLTKRPCVFSVPPLREGPSLRQRRWRSRPVIRQLPPIARLIEHSKPALRLPAGSFEVPEDSS